MNKSFLNTWHLHLPLKLLWNRPFCKSLRNHEGPHIIYKIALSSQGPYFAHKRSIYTLWTYRKSEHQNEAKPRYRQESLCHEVDNGLFSCNSLLGEVVWRWDCKHLRGRWHLCLFDHISCTRWNEICIPDRGRLSNTFSKHQTGAIRQYHPYCLKLQALDNFCRCTKI